jgi:hypothetical protein
MPTEDCVTVLQEILIPDNDMEQLPANRGRNSKKSSALKQIWSVNQRNTHSEAPASNVYFRDFGAA